MDARLTNGIYFLQFMHHNEWSLLSVGVHHTRRGLLWSRKGLMVFDRESWRQFQCFPLITHTIPILSILHCLFCICSYFIYNRVRDQINTLVAIDLSELVLLAIVVKQLATMIGEDNQSSAPSFPSIIWTLIEPTTIKITTIRNLWRVKFGMVDMIIGPAEQTTSQSLEEFIARYLQIHHQVDLSFEQEQFDI